LLQSFKSNKQIVSADKPPVESKGPLVCLRSLRGTSAKRQYW